MGPFTPQHDPLVLLLVAGEILRTADARAPETVSQRRYNDARALAGHSDAPRAGKLAARFGISWPVLRDRVLSAADPSWAVSIAAKQQNRRVLTLPSAVEAVRRVAARLDADHLTRRQYESERLLINASIAQAHSHGTHIRPMPSMVVLDQTFGFRRVLEAAGLAPDKNADQRTGLPRAQAIVIFVEHYGFRPKRPDLNWMRQHHRIQMEANTGTPHSIAIQAAADEFRSEGRWFPPKPPKNAGAMARPIEWKHLADGCPEMERLARDYPRERGMGGAYSPDEARAAIATAYDHLSPGQRLTVEHYRAISREIGVPSYKTISACLKRDGTSFPALVREEALRRRSRSRPTPR